MSQDKREGTESTEGTEGIEGTEGTEGIEGTESTESTERIKYVTTAKKLDYYAGAPFENSPSASELPMPPIWMLSKNTP